MRTKVFISVLSVVVLASFIFVFAAQASAEPVYAVNTMFTDLNTGHINNISALFAKDAVARNDRLDLTFNGKEAIGQYLQNWHREGRTYDIVNLEMEDDTVHFTVDISDRGHVWGQQEMNATVNNGMIENLEVLETRLTLWRISA